MNQYRVSFIDPENGVHRLNYYEVEDFCKNICLNEENKDKFKKFKRDYSYFSPYFDFVMFELNYIFANPLFSRHGLFHIGDALYEYPVNSLDYEKNFAFAKEMHEFLSPIPFMTKVSENELDINTANSDNTGDVMIDPNLYAMMSKSGTIDGSHGVTAATILNQLMIKSEKICNLFSDFLSDSEMNVCSDPINFIIAYLGFMRATAIELDGMIIANLLVLEKKHKDFLCECNDNYNIYDMEYTEGKSYIKEYREIIKKDFK